MTVNDGNGNTAVGFAALTASSGGSLNTALGHRAGQGLQGRESNNIDIGANVEGVSGESNTIRIGIQGTQTATFIAGISGATVTGTAVVVNGSGQLGVAPSSERFKEAIKPMGNASEGILALKPVTFRYKKDIDPDSIPQFGLVAEEVEKVNPDLVVRDAEGKVFTVRYETVNAMLLNEFLKEHKKTEKLKEHRTVQGQQKEINALKAELKEQKALIQKVSDQIQVTKPGPQVVNNP